MSHFQNEFISIYWWKCTVNRSYAEIICRFKPECLIKKKKIHIQSDAKRNKILLSKDGFLFSLFIINCKITLNVILVIYNFTLLVMINFKQIIDISTLLYFVLKLQIWQNTIQNFHIWRMNMVLENGPRENFEIEN